MNTLVVRGLFLLLVFPFIKGSPLNPRNAINEKNPSTFKKNVYANAKKMENYNLFNPKMDYDEWTPLGRGDPLKNDPTFDYVPPVLDRVHYWIDPSKRTPDPPVPNVYVSGSRTEPTLTIRSSSTVKYPALKPKEADSRFDTTSLLDPFFKLMDKAQFGMNFNSNSHYKSSPNRIQRPQYTNSKQQKLQPPQALQRPPYTMLMPPPPPSPSSSSTSLSVTSVKSGSYTAVQNRTRSPLTTALPSQTLSLLTSANTTTTINPTVLANTENVFKPVAIAMPGQIEDVKSETQPEIKYTTVTMKPITEDDLLILSQSTVRNKNTVEDEGIKLQQSQNLNHLDHEAANSYVIEKKRPQTNTEKNKETTIKYVDETMLPGKTSDFKDEYYTKEFMTWKDENVSSLRATTASAITSTKVNVLTTDPMFKHYKQPLEPIRGPFYLIIQGHSKVKTYGASKNPINRLLTSNEIKYDQDKEKKQKFEKKSRTLDLKLSTEKFAEKDGEASHKEVETTKKIQNNQKYGLQRVNKASENSNGRLNNKHDLKIKSRKKRSLNRNLNGKMKKFSKLKKTKEKQKNQKI